MGKKKYHRGRRKRKGNVFFFLLFAAAVVVFCFSGFQIYRILSGYYQGQKEYGELRKLAVKTVGADGTRQEAENGAADEEITDVWIDFDQLMQINPDTVAWLRFDPEPAQINYPVVQGPDNELYLHRTFSANDNTVGAIFVNVDNHSDFSDKNTIIYGHRMNDNSMFHDLEKYLDKSFWEANPYFYIYTPDGKENIYQIYSAGVVKVLTESYLTEFESDAAFRNFLDVTKSESVYDTGVEVGVEDKVVTLSTCTADSNDERVVLHGVKVKEKKMQPPAEQ